MSVSRRGKETIVWCLAVLSDNIVVSGDSHGRLTFWDSAMGDQIESYTTHKTDILSIAVSDDEKSLYCSGVDPVIVNFIKVTKNSGNETSAQWVKNVQRNIHEHDVRGLVINGEQLISIGVDGYLTLSSYPPKWVMRIPPMLPAPRSSLCARKKLLLLRYSNHFEVWKLGSYATNDGGNVLINNVSTKENTNHQENKLEEDSTIAIINRANIENTKQNRSLKLIESPVKLVSVQTKGNKQMRCCEISPSGEFIAYSTENDLRMLKLGTDEELSNVSLSKMIINGVSSACYRIAFTEDSRSMVAQCAGALHVLHIDPEGGATVTQTISTDKYLKSISILHLYISKRCPNGAIYLVVADTQGAIAVWTQGAKKFEHYVTLPKYQCVPSAVTVDTERQNLIVVYVDQKIVEYELNNKKFSEWPGSALPSEWVSRKSAVTSVATHSCRDAVIFQDETSLWIMERTKQNKIEPSPRKKMQGSKPGSMNLPLKIVPIKYLAGFHWISADEAVTLEVLPENIVAQLPPVVANKRHGTA